MFAHLKYIYFLCSATKMQWHGYSKIFESFNIFFLMLVWYTAFFAGIKFNDVKITAANICKPIIILCKTFDSICTQTKSKKQQFQRAKKLQNSILNFFQKQNFFIAGNASLHFIKIVHLTIHNRFGQFYNFYFQIIFV